jgi:hypothetical protein
MAFNTPATSAGWLSAKPAGFLTDLRLSTVFRDPVRPAFAPPPLLPTFYADTWGDYWSYWLVYGNTHVEPGDAQVAAVPPLSNRDAIASYLGRVNAVALVPAGVLLAGFGLGLAAAWRMRSHGLTGDSGDALLGLTIALSLLGYLFLLLRYPLLDVKAGYMLHAFPLAAVLGGIVLCRLRAAAPAAFRALAVLLVLTTAHNAGALLTRYPQWDPVRSTLTGSPHEWRMHGDLGDVPGR